MEAFVQPLLIQPPEDLPRELVVGYLEKCRHDLTKLKAALGRREFESVEGLGHQMKGTGRPYGFPVLTDLARLIELAAKHRNFTELGVQVGTLELYLSQVEVA